MASMSVQNLTDAIAIQVQQHVDHTIKSLLPQMHGLSILTTESTLSRTQDITEFQDLIQRININLNIVLQASYINYPCSVTKSRPDIIIPGPSTSEDGKRKHCTVSQLLPASPEARQWQRLHMVLCSHHNI